MPGLYINDGGALNSSLGSILGGIAAQVGPEGAARALALKYQTESTDIANQAAAEALQSKENATNYGPAALGQAGALPGAGPSVAGTITGYATPPPPPPLVGAMRHPAGTVLSTNPYGAQVQNWIQTGQASPEAWRGSILPTGQEMVGGPGSSTLTQNDIYKAQHVPLSGTAGTTTYIDPTKGNVPGNVVTFGEAGQAEAEAKELQNAVANAATGVKLAGAATDTEGVLDTVKQLHDTVAATTPGAVLGDNLRALLAQHGINLGPLSTREGALIAINTLLKGTVSASLATVSADPNSPVRGALQQANDYAPDPAKMDDAAFNVVLNQMYKITARQKEEGGPARLFNNSAPTAANARIYNNQIETLRAAREAEIERERQQGGGGGGNQPAPLVGSEAEARKYPGQIVNWPPYGLVKVPAQ